MQSIPFSKIERLSFLFSPKRPRIRFHDLCNPQTFPSENLFDFLCAQLHSPEKRKEKRFYPLVYFYENSETLRTKCFVSLWAELYEGEIFEIIVVRLLLLVLASALNSRSIALYKKMDKRVRQQIKTEKNICTSANKTRHEQGTL